MSMSGFPICFEKGTSRGRGGLQMCLLSRRCVPNALTDVLVNAVQVAHGRMNVVGSLDLCGWQSATNTCAG